MKKLFKQAKLFFYSLLVKDLFLSKVLKINILTVDIINYTGLIKKIGTLSGGVAGASLNAYGVPAFIGTPVGMAVGNYLGTFADNELSEINKKIKIIDEKNDKFIENQDTEKYITAKISACINDILDILIKNVNKLSEDDKKLSDEAILSTLTLNIFKDKKKKYSNIFFANLMNDENIRKSLIALIKEK